MGSSLAATERASLVRNARSSGTGAVDFGAFLNFAGFDDAELDDVADRIATRLRAVSSLGIDYSQTFKLFDMPEAHFITRREFREACRTLALPVTEAELHALMDKFASVADGELVGYADFLRFVAARGERSKQRRRAEETIRKVGKLSRRSAYDDDDDEDDARLVVEGSGYDGLGRNDASHSQTMRSAIGSATNTEPLEQEGEGPFMLAPWKVNRWLEGAATDDERRRFLELQKSFSTFSRNRNKFVDDAEDRLAAIEASQERSSVYDHTLGTVSRVVDHASAARKAYIRDFDYDVVAASRLRRRNRGTQSDSESDSDNGYRSGESAGRRRPPRRKKRGTSKGRRAKKNRGRYSDAESSEEDEHPRGRSRDRRETKADAGSESDEGRWIDRRKTRSRSRRSRSRSSRRSPRSPRSPRTPSYGEKRHFRRRSRSPRHRSASPTVSESSFDPVSASFRRSGRNPSGRRRYQVASDTSDF